MLDVAKFGLLLTIYYFAYFVVILPVLGLFEKPEPEPASIAEAYWQLHHQARDAWTHELDLRPYAETW